MRFTIAVLMVIAALAGCAAPQRMISADEMSAMTHRTFTGVTADQAVAAAERVLRLADGDDFAIDRDPDGLMATRNWTVYFVLGFVTGTDHWVLKTKPFEGGTDVSFAVGSVAQPAPARQTPRQAGDTRPRVMGAMHEGTAIYDLFWSRMAYLLGQRDTWMSCAESDARVNAGVVWGGTAALCNSFNVKDETPEGPMASVQGATRTSAR